MPRKATGDASERTTKKAAKTATKRATAKTAKKKTTKRAKPAAKKPKATAKPAATADAAGARLRVRQVRSGIGRAATYRRTLSALGLKHHQDEVVVSDNASMRGMLHKVRHLVRVTPEEA